MSESQQKRNADLMRRLANAIHQRDCYGVEIERLKADLARVTAERDRLNEHISRLIPRPSECLSYADSCAIIMELVRDYGDAECTVAWKEIVAKLDAYQRDHEALEALRNGDVDTAYQGSNGLWIAYRYGKDHAICAELSTADDPATAILKAKEART